MKKRRKRQVLAYEDADLNIMPFIDVFSVLNTFLLLSAVFVSLGSVKVQIPFLSSKKSDDTKPTRSFEVKVDATKSEIQLLTNFSLPPRNETKEVFTNDEAGVVALHAKLVQLRSQYPETDLVTLFTEDDILYEQVIAIIDAIKVRQKDDPVFEGSEAGGDSEVELKTSRDFIYPKVVMGSVIL